MSVYQLLLGLVFLLAVLYLAERFTRPPASEWEQAMAAFTENARSFAILLGTQLIPAFEEATVAVNEFMAAYNAALPE